MRILPAGDEQLLTFYEILYVFQQSFKIMEQ